MDKLHKLGRWLWANKERIFLLLMVVVLCYQVYQVINPKTVTAPRTLIAPRAQASEEDIPPELPPRPVLDPEQEAAALENQNPFWYHARPSAETEGDQEVTVDDLGVTLLSIQKAGDSYLARLRVGRSRTFVRVGEEFGDNEFELLDIDPDTETVEVDARSYGRSFTLSKQ